MTAQDEGVHISVALDVTIRQLKHSDLRRLEWYGQFKHYRRLFMRSYRGHLEGKRMMLVADVNEFPIARLFIQFNSPDRMGSEDNHGYLYSFHVMEMFQGHGIGTALINAAETILRERDFVGATIAVAKENEGALRLYQRQGYHIIGEDEGRWKYYDHRGDLRHVHEPCWLLKKSFDRNRKD